LLKNKANIVSTEFRDFALAHGVELMIENDDFSFVCAESTGDDADQRRFSTAGWAEQHEDFLLAGLQIYAAQYFRASCTLAETFPNCRG
jgi:hypothetical protein